MTRLKYLSPQEVEDIHQATLRILSETGVALTHPASLELLCGAGARVTNGHMLIPRPGRRLPGPVPVDGQPARPGRPGKNSGQWAARLTSPGGHGARPHQIIDPFYLAAHVILALNAIGTALLAETTLRFLKGKV